MNNFAFVTLANEGMTKLTNNLIRSIRSVGMNNDIYVTCMDSSTYANYSKNPDVSVLSVEDVVESPVSTEYSEYGTIKFQNMMMRKYPAIKQVLQGTKNDVAFVDSDIAFWRNIQEYFSTHIDVNTDILCSSEPDDIGYCCGFTYFTFRPNTLQFIDRFIVEQKTAYEKSGDFIGEQAIFNRLAIEEGEDCPAAIAALPEEKFCNGHYLKTPGRWTRSGNLSKGVVRDDMFIAHANWVKGVKNKVVFLKKLHLYTEGENETAWRNIYAWHTQNKVNAKRAISRIMGW
jgi:hypothetical protein